MHRILFNFLLAIDGVFTNKLRAILTALGIVFGVGAVIAMLAIGSGAERSILEQMKLIGSNNIVLKSVNLTKEDLQNQEGESEESSSSDERTTNPWSPGLTIEDLNAIKRVLPTVEVTCPEVIENVQIMHGGRQMSGRCIGTTNDFFDLNNISVSAGSEFHTLQMDRGSPVCVIGKNIQLRLFSNEDPIGKQVKVGNNWLTVIGVLDRRIAKKESLEQLGLRDYNSDIYIPISTFLIRFNDRAFITQADVGRQRGNNDQDEDLNYHQLDRAVLRINDTENLQASADVIARILKRRHQDLVDFEVEVPELLIQQQRKTQETFNLVLAVIAAISLLVGGIGIMNIMLASVLERIKEIGVRRSMGATRLDIIFQFLFEAILVSFIGGLIGIFLGIGAARLIASSAEIPTVVSTWSIILSFGVAFLVGLVFGIFPAQRAADQDPIKALRSE